MIVNVVVTHAISWSRGLGEIEKAEGPERHKLLASPPEIPGIPESAGKLNLRTVVDVS